MDWILYIYKKSFINKLKKALKKPVTYVYLALAVLYVFYMCSTFSELFDQINISSMRGFFVIASIMVFVFTPGNITSYIRKKGIVFKTCDVHMVFSAPVSPKLVLAYAVMHQFLILLIMEFVVFIVGIALFKAPIHIMLLYFIINFIVGRVVETSLVIIIYGNEIFSEKVMKYIRYALYCFIALFIMYLIYFAYNTKLNLGMFEDFFMSPFIRLFPIIGWNVSFLSLLFVGIDTVGIVGTVLYFVSVLAMAIFAYKLKCTGQFYEEAAKFADDYQIAYKKSQKGEIAVVGKKKKYGKADIEYKGFYAKAIYYRQLLEYKKNKTFIFGPKNLLFLGAGIFLAIIGRSEEFMEIKTFLIPGVCAYITLLFGGAMAKWGQEIRNPYTFLIPDSPAKKLWYATKVELIREFCNGCLIVIIPSIVLQLSVPSAILNILFYVCLQANKLYCNVLSEALLGNLLGSTGKSITQMLIQMIILAIAIVAALFVGSSFGLEIGFMVLIGVIFVLTVATYIGASFAFDKMETV